MATMLLTLGLTAPASAAGTMPYPLDEFARTFLSDSEIKALAPWGALVPDTPSGQECSADSSGGYSCIRVYPISPFGFSKPHALSTRTLPSPTDAQAAFAEAVVSNRAKATSVLSVTPTDFSIEWKPDPDHRVVSSGRLDRNHYVEASCASRLSPGPPVADVNTCTQMLLNAQVPRLAGFESPVIVAPAAPTGVLSAVKGSTATVTWIAPESDGGAPITGYTASSTGGELMCTAAPSTALVQACVASGAKAGVMYAFTVIATNARGSSAPSPASQPSRFTAKASAPRDASARVTGTSVVVKWRRPADLGGLKVLRYVVTSSPGGRSCTTSATSCVISGLSFSTRYRFAIRAVNGRGAGAAGMTASVKTSPPPPPPPAPTPPLPAPSPTPSDKGEEIVR